jgi:hypothetical protein
LFEQKMVEERGGKDLLEAKEKAEVGGTAAR